MPAGLGQEEVFGGGQAEGGIAEVLEALVVVRGVGGMFGGVGGMRQRGPQEGGVGEDVAEAGFKAGERTGGGTRPPGSVRRRLGRRVQGCAARRRSTVKARSLPRRSRATTAPLRSRR